MPSALAFLHELACRQFGLVTRQQVLEVLSPSQLCRRVSDGVLIPVHRGVYRFAGTQRSYRQRAMAICLAVGDRVAISHMAAAYLWQVSCIAASPLEITVPISRRAGDQAVRTHRLPLPPGDVAERWAIPVTTPARTVIDLSSRVPESLLDRVVDDLLRRRKMTVQALAQRLDDGDPLPRHRLSVLRDLIDWRRNDHRGASVPEDWMFDAIVSVGLPPPVRHYVVDLGAEVRELDLAYPDWKIGIEYDGWSFHSDATHFHHDRDKSARLQLEGWIVLQVTSGWTAELLVARVAAAIELRRDSFVAR
ncbi:MAG TPA: type IV toxin-antitoxin system AbiEi family antitoxin domain-containing protein [Acidimicrobiales bacterium]|nr:type IV toxin-antitoxin system AbiEi family antitoxin domain-containing protein [Acidimicrobiales bacterium]